jgi:non-heme chloroperoxidase
MTAVFHANFFKTQDHNQIFYQTNFPHTDGEIFDQPLVVLNYGLVCSSHHWKYQIDYFHDRGYRLLMHDYRGHFQSTGKDKIQEITFKQMAQDTHDLIQFLGAKKVFLIGHSMGVNVSLEMHRLNPESILGMVLMSGTVMPVRDVMFDNNLMQFIAPLTKKLLNRYQGTFRKIWGLSGWNPIVNEIIRRQGFNPARVESEFIEIYLNRVAELGPELFFQLYDEMGRHDIVSYCPRIKHPTLIISGDRDKVIPPYLQRLLHQLIPRSEFYLVHKGSHVPQVDYPQHINERMELFLLQHSQ